MRYSVSCLTILLCLWSLNDARAVLIGTGTGLGNTTAPADDPGFANVGICGSGSAVYLGNGWVLTAAHVNDGSGGVPTQAWFDGQFYKAVPGSAVQLLNPSGVALSTYTDLEMFRLETAPLLPSLQITPTAPAAGWQVVMIGNGRDRLNNQMAYWNSSWQPSSTPTAFAGDTWGNTQDLRWGTNVIDSAGVVQGLGMNSEMAFVTSFSARGTAYEAQGTPGDSGGGVFHKDSTGHWSLAGIMFSTTSLPGQPWATSIFGNTTSSADLWYYRDQIDQIMAGLPIDVNKDGVVNAQDLALIASSWLKTSTAGKTLAGDLNRDGIVNAQDLALISSLASSTSFGRSVAAIPEPPSYVLGLASCVAFWLLAQAPWRRPNGDGLRN